MCGISGFINPHKNKIAEHILTDFGKALHHRGPDAVNYYYNHYIGLTHNRLSILDLSENGNQPFEDASQVLIYNGEIYNYLELKKTYLDSRGISFRSTSDTEVLFYLLKFEGVERTLALVKGMFAFALYEKSSNRLTLARDRIGIKPLFYGKGHDGTLFFASEYKAILGVMQPRLDKVRALYSVFGILDKSRDYTLFENIHHVPPGHYLQITGEEIHLKSYFKLSDLVDPSLYHRLRSSSPKEVQEEFHQLLSGVVKAMLMSDAPMGAFVSGGIDSSLIAAMAVQHQPIQLFTANVVGKFSEVADARQLAANIGAPLAEYEFKPEYFIRDLVRCTWHMEVPIVVHTNAVPFSGVAQLARANQVKAVLTGEGSDELFLGYPRLLTRHYDQLIKGPYEVLNKIYRTVPGLSRYVLKQSEFQTAGTLELLTQKFQRQLLREEEMPYLDHVPPKERQDQYLSFQMMYEGIVALLWRNDRMGMISSIEARFPFLDEAVLQFALNLPVKYKIGRTSRFYNYKHPFLMDKYIVRQAAQRYLKDSLVYKKKNGFPMYGYNYLRIDKNLFHQGFLGELLDLNQKQLDYFVSNTDRYVLAKFFALEIWAKLFLQNEKSEQVEETVRRHTSIAA